jgi:CRP-like cAMP-binding protein
MNAELLGALNDADRRLVVAKMTRRTFRKGDTIFFEGDPGDSLMIVQKGRVAVRVSTPDGDVATLVVLGAGSCFGEQALVDAAAVRTASVVALEAVEVRALDRHDFDDLRSRHPAVERFLIGLLASQVRRLSGQVLDALYVSADKRVIRRTTDLARVYATDAVHDRIDIPMRQEDIASMAGTTRPTANRVLKQLEEEGVLTLARGRTVITDLAELERRAR